MKFGKNLKDKINKFEHDPYAGIKFQYQITRVIVIAICAFIAITFFFIIRGISGFGYMDYVIKAITLAIGIYLLFQIYNKTLLPQKRLLNHYHNVPPPETEKHINVADEIDSILDQYDEDGNKKK